MINTVTPARAAEILREHGMRTSAETLRYGLAQGRFPFGEAITSPTGDNTYYIYERLLMNWIRQREEIPGPQIQTGTIYFNGEPEFSDCSGGETII